MRKTLRLVVLILLAPLVYAFACEAYLFVRSNVTLQSITWFLAGLASCTVLYTILVSFDSKTVRLAESLRHELAHFVASTLLLKMPESLLVTSREEGTVGLTGPVRPWFWAVLAPYYFPVFTIPLLLIKPVVSTSLRNVMDLLIGFTLAFHYLSTVRRGFYGQIDVKTMGRIFSTIVTLALNVVWLVIILCVVTNNYAGIVTYFKSSLIRALGIYKAIPQWWEVTGRQVVGQAWEAVKGLWE